MLDTLDDEPLTNRLRSELEESFIRYVTDPGREWWTTSEGRGALMLPGLVYCSREVAPGPEADAALYRALWALCAESSPMSIQSMVERKPATRTCGVIM